MGNKKFDIQESSTLYKGWSTLTKYILKYLRNDGNIELQYREIFDSGDGAAVLLYNTARKKIILIRQFRLAAWLQGHPTGFIVEVCAGMLDDKDPTATIIKEIEEETGYVVKDVHKIMEAYATPGAHKEKIHFYIGQYDPLLRTGKGGGVAHETEEIEVLEYDMFTIPDLLQSGKIQDAKTIILLQYGLLKGIITT